MTKSLHPGLLAALSAVDRGEVRTFILGARRVWIVSGERNTPAVQCLLDAGLVEEDRECIPPLVVTGAGRALLNTLNPNPES